MGARNSLDTAIIGAGWSGLAAAQMLAEAGQDVMVVEKSRGPGGRSATRREGKGRFDHGAQYFTARAAAFGRQLQRWLDGGQVATWKPRLTVIGGTRGHSDPDDVRRFVAVPGMNGVCHAMAESVPCRFETRVRALTFDRHWRLELDDGESIEAQRLMITAPPAQAAGLLGAGHPLHEPLSAVRFTPCIAVMVAFGKAFDAGFDAAFVNDDGPLSWIARDSSKPGRSGENWVAHATAEWSGQHLDEPPESLNEELVDALTRYLPDEAPEPRRVTVHRWRYAQVAEPLDDGIWTLPEQRLVIAGDWLNGSRIEGAWTSGRRAGTWLLSSD